MNSGLTFRQCIDSNKRKVIAYLSTRGASYTRNIAKEYGGESELVSVRKALNELRKEGKIHSDDTVRMWAGKKWCIVKEAPKPTSLFLELDPHIDKNELKTFGLLHGLENGFVFDKIIANCGINGRDVWESVKSHDNIYFSSALLPNYLSPIHSGKLFQLLMRQSIEEKLEGKKIYIFKSFQDIRWYNLEKEELLRGCFLSLNNEIYTQEEICDKFCFVRADIENIIKEM